MRIFRRLGQIDFVYEQISLISIAPNKQKWNKEQLDLELSHKLTNFTMVQTTMGGFTFLEIYFVINHEDYIPVTFSQIPKVTFLKLN
jgi:hypothetical protein